MLEIDAAMRTRHYAVITKCMIPITKKVIRHGHE